jgi:hypothetical protein
VRVVGDNNAAVLRAVSAVARRGGSLSEVSLFCLEGRLSVGDRLTAVDSPEGVHQDIDAEVLEILFFQRMIDGLDAVFSGQVLVSGDTGSLAEGWSVTATSG